MEQISAELVANGKGHLQKDEYHVLRWTGINVRFHRRYVRCLLSTHMLSSLCANVSNRLPKYGDRY